MKDTEVVKFDLFLKETVTLLHSIIAPGLCIDSEFGLSFLKLPNVLNVLLIACQLSALRLSELPLALLKLVGSLRHQIDLNIEVASQFCKFLLQLPVLFSEV